MQDKFRANIVGGKRLLDFGCESGRDKDVDATDVSYVNGSGTWTR